VLSPKVVFTCFVELAEQTAANSMNRGKKWVSVMETQCFL